MLEGTHHSDSYNFPSSVYTIDHPSLPLQPHCLSRSCVNEQSSGPRSSRPPLTYTYIPLPHHTLDNTTTTKTQHTSSSRTLAHHGLRGA